MAEGVIFDPLTALIVVDVQNDFADPAGKLYVPEGEKVVDPINELVDRAVQAGSYVAYTQDWHPEKTPHFQPDGPWPPHCIQGSWGADLHPRLRVVGPLYKKGAGQEDGYSGFFARDVKSGELKSTGLKEDLEKRGIKNVVVVGLARDVCVKDTALDAKRLGLNTFVVMEATRPVTENAAAAERELRDAGVKLV